MPNLNLQRHTILEKRWIEILGTVGASIEEAHQEHHVDEQDPIFPDGFSRFSNPSSEASSLVMAGATDTIAMIVENHRLSFSFHDLECVGLRKHQTEGDDKDRRASAEPE